jgi:predicted  nucleic acid-binding Zn-ribbon protein
MAQSELQIIKEELLAKLASKEEIAEVRKDLSGLKNDVAELNKRVSSLEKKVDRHSASISKLSSEVITMKEKMFTREEHAEIYGRILEGQDTLIKKFDDMRIEMTSQDAKTYRLETYIKEESQRNDLQDKILQRHDTRIKKLESAVN